MKYQKLKLKYQILKFKNIHNLRKNKYIVEVENIVPILNNIVLIDPDFILKFCTFLYYHVGSSAIVSALRKRKTNPNINFPFSIKNEKLILEDLKLTNFDFRSNFELYLNEILLE